MLTTHAHASSAPATARTSWSSPSPSQEPDAPQDAENVSIRDSTNKVDSRPMPPHDAVNESSYVHNAEHVSHSQPLSNKDAALPTFGGTPPATCRSRSIAIEARSEEEQPIPQPADLHVRDHEEDHPDHALPSNGATVIDMSSTTPEEEEDNKVEEAALHALFDKAAAAKPIFVHSDVFFGFSDEVVEDAYQASLAETRLTGCAAFGVALSFIFLFRMINFARGTTMLEVDAWWVIATVSAACAGVVAVTLLIMFACLRSKFIQHQNFIRWTCKGYTVATLFYCCTLITNIQNTGASEATVVANGIAYGVAAFAVPLIIRMTCNTSLLDGLVFLGVTNTVLLYTFSATYGFQSMQTSFQLLGVVVVGSSLYLSERSARRGFLCQIHVSELLREVQAERAHKDAVETASKAEAGAFKAINHCAKRVMYNNVSTIGDLQRTLVPKLTGCCSESDVKELVESLDSMLLDNEKGHEKCKDALILKQISAGSYKPVLEPVDVKAFCKLQWGAIAKLKISVDATVPQWLLTSTALLNIILENAIHNAIGHGMRGGEIVLRVSVTKASQLLIAVENEAGRNHVAALKMQSEHGKGAIVSASDKINLSGIGSSSSTFLGMGEMRDAAALLGGTLSLVFYPQLGLTAPHTLFSLTTDFSPTSAPVITNDEEEVPSLREGTILVCADDDAAPRIGYKGLIKKLEVNESMILGATYDEMASLVETVLAIAEDHGDEKVVCIFDQNMEYKQGVIRGTEVAADLRREGFKGVVLIRSANDDDISGCRYRAAGANGYLSKKTNVKQLVREVVRECELVWKMAL